MYIGVSAVEPLDNYTLHLTFENGEEKLFSMKPYLDKGVFKVLRDETLFKQATVTFDTVCWNDMIDIDPETLYEDAVPVVR